MKCERYEYIRAECAYTLSDDEYEECNEGENLGNESMTPANLFVVEKCWS